KYNVLSVPKVMANCGEVVAATGVARKSATILAMMLVAAVCEVALRFVCMPTGIRPKTAIRQKAATPKARTSSTTENPPAPQARCKLLKLVILMVDRPVLLRL